MTKFFSVFFLFFSLCIFSQNIPEKSFEYSNEKLEIVLLDVEKSFDVKFSYLDALIENYSIDLDKKSYTLQAILKDLDSITGLSFRAIDSRYYVIYTKEVAKETLFTDQQLNEVIINAYLTKGIVKNKDNTFTILPQKLAILPGLIEADVLQTLQQLPGVISPNETATGLHVRGGTPDQNLILWDGIKMYHNGHLFGMISGFNPNVTQSIQFYNKGTDPRYGDRISSVIDIRTATEIPNKTQLEVGLNALSADVFINQPIIKDKLNIQISGRRSFTDLLQSVTYDKYANKVFQNTKIAKEQTTANSLYYQDFNAKINYHFSDDNILSVSAILIDNDLDNTILDVDTKTNYTDKLDIKNEGYSFDWRKKWDSKWTHIVNAYYSNYELNYNYLTDYVGDRYVIFTKRNLIRDTGFGLGINYEFTKNRNLDVGYQLTSNDVSHAFLSKNQDLSFVLDTKSEYMQTHSVYANFHYKPTNIFGLIAGLRYNYYAELKESVVEPRVTINLSLSDKLKASVTGEIRNQIISQIKETVVSDLSLENQLWVLSDATEFPILNAHQVTVGLMYKYNSWTLDVDTYFKKTKGLTTLTLGFLNPLDPNYHIGESQSKGIDFYIKKDFNTIKAWATYSFNTTNNKFEGINDDAYFPNNSEIKHAVNLSTSYKINRFQLALGWYWRTGKPYTQVTNLTDNFVSTIEYDKINEGRLPNYHRLDVSSIYNFNVSKNKGVKGKFGISIYNIYNQKNLLNREYLRSETLGDEIQVRDRNSLEFTPNLFFRFSF